MNNKGFYIMTNVNTDNPSFGVVPVTQFDWALNQPHSIVRLWMECWKCEPYGDIPKVLVSDSQGSTFRKARKVISDAGLFEFHPVYEKGGKKIANWLVLNLTKRKRTSTRRFKYRQFLKSQYWKEVRSLVLTRDNKTCVKCGSKRLLQVHHLTYKHHTKEKEHLDDLITLCKYCHKKEHADT